MNWKAVKKPFSLLSVLLLGISLAACQGSNAGSSGAKPGADKSGGKQEDVTITLQTLLKADGTSPREKAFAEVVKNFTQETGIKVKYITLPWQELDSQLILSVQAGNPPDVSYVHDREFLNHMQAKSLMPLDNYIKSDITDTDKKDFLLWDKVGMSSGHKYTFPIAFTAETLFIRKDLLDKAGLQPPKTWDDFIKVAQALQTPQIAGHLFGAAVSQPNQLDWLQPMIENRGGKVLDDKGRAGFDSQAGIDSFKFLKSTIYDSKIMPTNALSMNFDQATDAFSAGRAAMIFMGSNRYETIAKALGTDKLLSTYMPGVDGSKYSPVNVLGWDLGIPQGSKQPDAAWKFIKYFTSPKSVLTYAKGSGEVPIRQSTVQDDFYKSPEGKTVNFWVNYIKDNGTSAVATPEINQLNDIIATVVQAVISDPNSNVEKIVKDAAKKYNAIVDSKK